MVRRYTNKELRNMTPEEGERFMKERLAEHERLGQQITDVLAGNYEVPSKKNKGKKK